MISLDYVLEYINDNYGYDLMLLWGFDIQQDYSVDVIYVNSVNELLDKIFSNNRKMYDNWEKL